MRRQQQAAYAAPVPKILESSKPSIYVETLGTTFENCRTLTVLLPFFASVALLAVCPAPLVR